MCKKFEGWNLDSRLRYFVDHADRRRCKIAGRCVGPKFMSGLPKYDGDTMTDKKAEELYRRFWKNKKWADYCQNRRYELAGL